MLYNGQEDTGPVYGAPLTEGKQSGKNPQGKAQMKHTHKKDLPGADQNTLIYAVLHGKDSTARCAALEKIVNVESFIDDLLDDPDPNVRLTLTEKIGTGEKDLLKKIALCDEDKYVRCAAVRKIKEAETLITIALNDKEEDVRNTAGEQYRHLGRNERSGAAERICDTSALIYIAERDQDALIRQEAVKKIDDEKALTEAALHDPDQRVQTAAVRRILEVYGTKALGGVMQQAEDRYIRKFARKLAAGEQFSMKDIKSS